MWGNGITLQPSGVRRPALLEQYDGIQQFGQFRHAVVCGQAAATVAKQGAARLLSACRYVGRVTYVGEASVRIHPNSELGGFCRREYLNISDSVGAC